MITRLLFVQAAAGFRHNATVLMEDLLQAAAPGKGERPSFLKKRSKKLLDVATRASQRSKPHKQKFFGSFFKKERLAFFARVSLNAVWY